MLAPPVGVAQNCTLEVLDSKQHTLLHGIAYAFSAITASKYNTRNIKVFTCDPPFFPARECIFERVQSSRPKKTLESMLSVRKVSKKRTSRHQLAKRVLHQMQLIHKSSKIAHQSTNQSTGIRRVFLDTTSLDSNRMVNADN